MTPLLSTVVLDPFTALIVGSALGVASGALIRKRPEAELMTTALLGASWAAWYGICVGWFFFARPDWMFAYLVDTQKVPLVPAYLFFLAVLVTLGVGGALATGVLMQHGRPGSAIALTLGAVAANLGLMAVQSHAYSRLGTYAQYLKGEAPGLETDSAMTLAMTVSGAAAAVVAVGLLGWRFVKGR